MTNAAKSLALVAALGAMATGCQDDTWYDNFYPDTPVPVEIPGPKYSSEYFDTASAYAEAPMVCIDVTDESEGNLLFLELMDVASYLFASNHLYDEDGNFVPTTVYWSWAYTFFGGVAESLDVAVYLDGAVDPALADNLYYDGDDDHAYFFDNNGDGEIQADQGDGYFFEAYAEWTAPAVSCDPEEVPPFTTMSYSMLAYDFEDPRVTGTIEVAAEPLTRCEFSEFYLLPLFGSCLGGAGDTCADDLALLGC